MEAIIFCGIQGTGKSTFFRDRFFDTHLRINLDMLRTRHRERLLVLACLEAKQPFVVDNTNPTRADRARYLFAAKLAGFRAVGYFFDVPVGDALARNERRSGQSRVPQKGVIGTWRRLEPPTWSEGYDALFRVGIDPDLRFRVEDLIDEVR